MRSLVLLSLVLVSLDVYSRVPCTPELLAAMQLYIERAQKECFQGSMDKYGSCGTAPNNVMVEHYEFGLTRLYGQINRVCVAYRCFGERNPQADSYNPLFSENWCDPLTPPKIISVNPKPEQKCGSVIEPTNQVVGERIPLAGASFDLVYFSNKVIGRQADYKITIPTTTPLVAPTNPTYSINIKDDVGNLVETRLITDNPQASSVGYVWNGLDTAGQEPWASVLRSISSSGYGAASIMEGNFAMSNFMGFVLNGSSTSNPPVPVYVGKLKAKKLGIGAWVPSVWHFYDKNTQTLYKGDGQTREKVTSTITEGSYVGIPDESGKEVYFFDSIGKIAYTKSGLTGFVLYTFAYDTSERLISITEPFSKVTTFARTNGVLKTITAPNSAKATITFDTNGYLSKVVGLNSETYNMTYYGAGGLLKTFTPPSGDVTTLIYDADGNLTSDTHASGYAVTLENLGVNSVKSTSAEGRVTTNSFNPTSMTELFTKSSGLNISTVNNNTSTSVTSLVESTTTNYSADPRFGLQVKTPSAMTIKGFGIKNISISNTATLTTASNPFSIDKLTTVVYDYPLVATSVYTGATKTFTTTTGLNRTSSTVIDQYERPVSTQTGTQTAKVFTYTNDLLTKITQGVRSTTLTYVSGKLIKTIKDALGQTTSFTYDAAQRLKTTTLPDLRVINYIYDSNGNLKSITPPGRPLHQMVFGLNGKLSNYNPPGSSIDPNLSTNHFYNNDKQLTRITRPDNQEIHFDYNPTSGLLESINGDFGAINTTYNLERPATISGQNNRVINHTAYQGNVVTESNLAENGLTVYSFIRGPSNSPVGKIGSEYIAAGGVSKTFNYTYDNDQLLKTAGDLTLTYNVPNGELTGTTLGSLSDAYTYNSFGEVLTYIAKFNTTVIYQYTLVRDNIGRVTKKTEVLNNITKVFDYTYDKAGRLTEVKTNNVVTSTYTYDSNSNRNGGAIRGEVTSATYDDQDRLTNYNGEALTYTNNGELLTKGSSSYVYDVFGNLKQYSNPATSTTVTYDIDPLQRRFGKRVNGVLKAKYAYTPEGKLFGELDTNSRLVRAYVYGTKSHVPDYFTDYNSGQLHRIITDHLGSVRLVITGSGVVKQIMEHDEFGRVVQDTAPGYTMFGFAGGVYDGESKLVRFGVRDFDSQTGRWTAKDPILFEGGDPNLYGYVLQDPINLIDPDGKLALPIIGGLIIWAILPDFDDHHEPGIPKYEFGPGAPWFSPNGPIDRRRYERDLEKEIERNRRKEPKWPDRKCTLT